MNHLVSEYLAWTIFNAVSHPPEQESQDAAWERLTPAEKEFANSVWVRVEELENREVER
jgi:hypothetical protein